MKEYEFNYKEYGSGHAKVLRFQAANMDNAWDKIPKEINYEFASLREKRNIPSYLYSTFTFGLHSNIPLCCVIVFCLEFFLKRGPMFGKNRRKMWCHERGERPHYIPCPVHDLLYAFKLVRARELHMCDDSNPECSSYLTAST